MANYSKDEARQRASCPIVKQKVEQVLTSEKVRGEVRTSQFHEFMCAVDVNLDHPALKLDIMNKITEKLKAEDYAVTADVTSRCEDVPGWGETGRLGIRLNVQCYHEVETVEDAFQ